MVTFLIVFTILLALRVVDRVSNEPEGCLHGKFGFSPEGRALAVLFTGYHAIILYLYVILVGDVLKQKDKHLINVSSRNNFYYDLYSLTQRHAGASVLIIGSTWLRFIYGFQQDDLTVRVLMSRCDYLASYIGMVVCVVYNRSNQTKNSKKQM
eukprot:UN34783